MMGFPNREQGDWRTEIHESPDKSGIETCRIQSSDP